MNNIELRFVNFSVEASDTDDLTVKGYVNEVGKYSHLLGIRKQFKERILPGAFTRALAENDDIHFLAEHDANKILASTRNDSLKLVEDEKGLFMEATISPTSYGKDYHTLIKDGILRNMSFGFNVIKDSWKKMNDGTYTRDISDLRLFEVSVVTNPAYPQSTISARGLHLVEDVEIPQDIENTEERNMENEVSIKKLAEEIEDSLKKTIVEKDDEITTKVKEVTEDSIKESEVKSTKDSVEVKVKEVKELKEEKRAYISYIYDDHDLMNVCLDLSAQCLTLARHFSKNNIFTEKIQPLKSMSVLCNDMTLSLVSDAEQNMENNVDTRSQEVSKKEEKENTTVEEKVEERSQDLNELYSMLDSLKRKGE